MKNFLFSIFTCLFLPILIYSQNENPTLFNHFYNEDTLHITIETDLKPLIRKKDSENYQAAYLTFINKKGERENWTIRLRARGNMRKSICFLPPLKVKFDKEEVKGRGLSGGRKFKLVTQCKGTKAYEQYVLQEHLIYKSYNILTEESFRIQLVYFTIKDTKGKMKTIKSFGFFIEPAKDLAERMEGIVIEPKIISPRGLEASTIDRMSIFQFMIGNTDWYIYNRHNLKILSTPRYRLGLVVPYDFDYSGLINAPYAAPHKWFPMESVRERFYIGYCRDDPTWTKNLQLFRDKKTEIIALFKNTPFLENYSRKSGIKYIEDFYEIIENKGRTKRMMKEHCDILIKRK